MSGILIIAEHLDGKLANITKELVGASQKIASDLQGPAKQGPVKIALLSDGPGTLDDQLNLAGVDEIIHCNIGTSHFDAALYEETILQLGAKHQPAVILLGHTANGLACAASIAARVGAGFASDIIDLAMEESALVATRSAHGGKVNTELVFPGKECVVLAIRGATFPAIEAAGSATISEFEHAEQNTVQLTKHKSYLVPESSGTDIGKAEIILSVGRGIQDPENIKRFEAIADKLNVTLGCSRPFADAGHLPKAHQVGQSGTVAASCKLYIAVGISGAVQHLYGMKHVDTIIAINTDAGAPIFGFSTFGSTLDALELASALEAKLEIQPA